MDVETVADENNDMVLTAGGQHTTFQEFLHADLVVSMHATPVEDPGDIFRFEFDLDGPVIQLDNLSGVVAGFHYLWLPVHELNNVKPRGHRMEKHFHLSGLGANSVACLRTIHGVTLGNVDGLYFLDVTFIPPQHETARSHDGHCCHCPGLRCG